MVRSANAVVGDLLNELHCLGERIAEYERDIEVMARAGERCRKLMAILGLSEKTTTALMASTNSAYDFK